MGQNENNSNRGKHFIKFKKPMTNDQPKASRSIFILSCVSSPDISAVESKHCERNSSSQPMRGRSMCERRGPGAGPERASGVSCWSRVLSTESITVLRLAPPLSDLRPRYTRRMNTLLNEWVFSYNSYFIFFLNNIIVDLWIERLVCRLFLCETVFTTIHN